MGYYLLGWSAYKEDGNNEDDDYDDVDGGDDDYDGVDNDDDTII